MKSFKTLTILAFFLLALGFTPGVVLAEHIEHRGYQEYRERFNYYQRYEDNYYHTNYQSYPSYPSYPRPVVVAPPPIYNYNYYYTPPTPVYNYYSPPIPLSLPTYTAYYPVSAIHLPYFHHVPILASYR